MDLPTGNEKDQGKLTVIGYGILTAMVAILVIAVLSISKEKLGPQGDTSRDDIVIPSNLT